MTEMEKYVVVRLCAKLMQYADLGEDKEVNDLIDQVLLSNNIKENINKIRALASEYKGVDREQRMGIKKALKRNSELCNERDALYEEYRN